MILLLCAVKRGRSPFDTIKNKTESQNPNPKLWPSAQAQAWTSARGLNLDSGSGCLSVCLLVRLSVCVEDATVATNASDDGDDDDQHDPKQCTEQNQKNNNNNNNKILYSYFMPKMRLEEQTPINAIVCPF